MSIDDIKDPSNWTVAYTFQDSIEANLVKNMLHQKGYDAEILDQSDSAYNRVVGEVKLLTPEEQAAEVRQTIEEYLASINFEEDENEEGSVRGEEEGVAGSDAWEDGKLKTAVFGGGCFWCTEAIFQRLKGVHHVESGYMGGKTNNPTYKDVSREDTGHAEVIRVTYDPEQISYDDLLQVFYSTHDPTTLNRQGADVGTQYRSVVFYTDNDERNKAQELLDTLVPELWGKRGVTQITEIVEFYPAEAYHQDYYNQNPSQRYCSMVIEPKVKKFAKQFQDKLNSDYV